MNGPHDFIMITAEQAYELDKGLNNRPLAYLEKLARKNRLCSVCGQLAWRFADTGMCFTCTTGESDASNYYELI